MRMCCTCGLAALAMPLCRCAVGAPAPKAPWSDAAMAGALALTSPALGALVVRGLRTEVQGARRLAIWVDEDAVQNKSSPLQGGRRSDDDCEGERLPAGIFLPFVGLDGSAVYIAQSILYGWRTSVLVSMENLSLS